MSTKVDTHQFVERLGERQQPPGGDRHLRSAGSDLFSNGKRL
ncbi:hypothetical protein [Stenotrophomonas maltophilia]|nr:hypothetical protein [Stenotrophomonas maltophilia]